MPAKRAAPRPARRPCATAQGPEGQWTQRCTEEGVDVGTMMLLPPLLAMEPRAIGRPEEMLVLGVTIGVFGLAGAVATHLFLGRTGGGGERVSYASIFGAIVGGALASSAVAFLYSNMKLFFGGITYGSFLAAALGGAIGYFSSHRCAIGWTRRNGAKATRRGVIVSGAIGLPIALIFLVPVVGVILIAAIPAAPCVLILRYARHRAFCRRHRGQAFLICSRRRGWFHFIRNNVITVLPPEVACLWTPGGKSDVLDKEVSWILQREFKAVMYLNRPFLLVVDVGRCRFVRLHEALFPLKGAAKVSRETQERVRALVMEALRLVSAR